MGGDGGRVLIIDYSLLVVQPSAKITSRVILLSAAVTASSEHHPFLLFEFLKFINLPGLSTFIEYLPSQNPLLLP
jgi:hypothetical protein